MSVEATTAKIGNSLL